MADDRSAAGPDQAGRQDRTLEVRGYRLRGYRLGGWLLGGAAIVCGGVAYAVDATGSWQGIGLASWLALVAGTGLGLVGAVVVDHQPRNPAAWCVPVSGMHLALAGLLSALAGVVDPAAVEDLSKVLLWFSGLLDSAATATGALLLLLFPAGRVPDGRLRWLWWLFVLSIGLVVLPGIAISAWSLTGPELASLSADVEGLPVAVIPPVLQVLVVWLYGWWIVAAALLVVRLRRAQAAVRRQLQWAVVGLVGTAAILLTGVFLVEWPIQILAALPTYLGILVAMRWHGLWEADRLLRQATVYVVLSLCLAVLYAAVVILVSLALEPLTTDSPIAVAAATLVAAAAFTPLRRRLQAWVDRRFDERTWQAVRVMQHFSERLRTGASRPAEIEDALRRALREPTLRIRYVDAGRIIGIDGVPAETTAAPGHEWRMVATGGHDVAVVDLPTHFAAEHALMIDTVLTAAALSLENAALHARMATQLAEVQASRARLVEAADTERRRIERDLHDGAQQRLVAVALGLRMQQLRLQEREPAEAEALADAVGEVRRAVDELRELSRGMLPPVLSEEGLGIALRTLAARLPVPLVLDIPRERYPDNVEATAWFVSCEGLTNAVKHARAQELRISVRRDDGWLRMEVRDDGTGGAAPTPGGGLQGLADRVAAIGGRLTIDSRADTGTTIAADLPCAS